MGLFNPRAICPSCGAKIHTQGRFFGGLPGLGSTGKICPQCGVKLTGFITPLTNNARLAPEVKAAKKAAAAEKDARERQTQAQEEDRRARQERLAKPWTPGSKARMWSCPKCATRSSRRLDRCPECGAANPEKPRQSATKATSQTRDPASVNTDADETPDLASQLEALVRMRDEGALTDEEFAAAKARIL